jgi:hypothetical protein
MSSLFFFTPFSSFDPSFPLCTLWVLIRLRMHAP